MDSQQLDVIVCKLGSYYSSASVLKWLQKQSQRIQFLKISWGSMPQDPTSLLHLLLCMHISHATPLLKSCLRA